MTPEVLENNKETIAIIDIDMFISIAPRLEKVTIDNDRLRVILPLHQLSL